MQNGNFLAAVGYKFTNYLREPVPGPARLAVSNIEEVVAHVEKLGIDASERSSGAQVKTLMIVDPDGNHIAFAEALDKSMAS